MASEEPTHTLGEPRLRGTTQPIRRNLVLVARRPERFVFTDFCEVAAYCREMAPDIFPIPLFDAPSSLLRFLSFIRPTLIFAPRRLLFYHPLRGIVRSGQLLPKSPGTRDRPLHAERR
jgi:hypothetical protein